MKKPTRGEFVRVAREVLPEALRTVASRKLCGILMGTVTKRVNSSGPGSVWAKIRAVSREVRARAKERFR